MRSKITKLFLVLTLISAFRLSILANEIPKPERDDIPKQEPKPIMVAKESC